MGLGLGNYSVNPIQWGKQNFVVVSTESRKPYKKQLLKVTVGTWGEIHENSGELRIYVDSPTFGFMIKLPIDAKFLDAKTRFAPFLLGTLAARLTDREDRLSLSNEALLKRIHQGFSRHFGFDMGNFRVEHRTAQQNDGDGIGNDQKVPVIQIKNPGEVFAALIQVNSVRSLPFIKDIGKISSS